MSTQLNFIKKHAVSPFIVDPIKEKFFPNKKVSYSRWLWSNYTNIVKNAEPTRFATLNKVAKVIFAITALVPCIIATIGTITIDAAIKLKRNVKVLLKEIKKAYLEKHGVPQYLFTVINVTVLGISIIYFIRSCNCNR